MGIGDLDRPALLLERVVDQPGSGHRLDDRADRLVVELVDATGQGPQRVDIGWHGELIKMLPATGEQADIELPSTQIESSVQHVKRASLVPLG